MQHYDVVVVGAGLAGLHAAYTLAKQYGRTNTVVLDAANKVGGRAAAATPPSDTHAITQPGAEFVHGADSLAGRLARKLRLPLEQVFTAAHGDGGPSEQAAPDGGTALYYVAPDRILAADSDDAGLVRLTSALRELAHCDDGDERSKASVHDFLCARGVPPEMMMLAQASYANTLGAGRALDELPLAAVARLERLWASDGEGDFRFRDSVGALADGLASELAVCTEWEAARIERVPGGVRVLATDGRQVSARRAVVALPVAVLRGGRPLFDPPLREEKVAAIRSIRTLRALKIVLEFACRPWGEKPDVLHSVICGAGELIPELWLHPRAGRWLVSGFATGSYADSLAAMPASKATDAFVSQCERVLPDAPDLGRALLRSEIVDWGSDRHFAGGYSSPSFDEASTPNARAVYREVEWEGRLHFAGEATQESYMTMSAALESGVRVATEAAMGLLRDARSIGSS